MVAENVAGIVDMELDNILDDLEIEGYEAQAFIIPASAVKAPHRRERLWIVAHAMRERQRHGFHNSRGHEIEHDWERDLTAAQAEWAELFPQSWSAFNLAEWIQPITNPYRELCGQESKDPQTVTQRPKRPDAPSRSGSDRLQYAAHTIGEQVQPFNQQIGTERQEPGPILTGTDRRVAAEPPRHESKPPFPGMDDGLSRRLDGPARNKALGNAIVPQVVYPILRLIALMEEATL